MVPKVAKKGTSFKGAGQYYLHDKQADTAERVEFTHTENLPTRNPETAIKCMAHTAMRQNEIKAANGAARAGRKLTYPVYSYSLSWAPDEQPTQEQMIAAGKETLHELGLADHEVLMVAHNDEPHPHLHLIVNRVHPETGKAAGLSNDHLTLSRWAEAYERMQGQIRCEERVENNARRKEGEFVRHSKQQLVRWRRERVTEAIEKRAAEAQNLSTEHAQQRRALYRDKENRIRLARQEAREPYRRHWATLYQHQKGERDKLAIEQAAAGARLSSWLKDRTRDRWEDNRGRLSDAFRHLEKHQQQIQSLEARQTAERAQLAERIHDRTREQISERIRDINRQYQQELQHLKERQTGESRTLQKRHSKESQDGARAIASGEDVRQFRKEMGTPELRDAFAGRVRDRIEQTPNRREQKRERGNDQEAWRTQQIAALTDTQRRLYEEACHNSKEREDAKAQELERRKQADIQERIYKKILESPRPELTLGAGRKQISAPLARRLAAEYFRSRRSPPLTQVQRLVNDKAQQATREVEHEHARERIDFQERERARLDTTLRRFERARDSQEQGRQDIAEDFARAGMKDKAKTDFTERVRDRLKETRKRRSEERKRGKDRDGGRERE